MNTIKNFMKQKILNSRKTISENNKNIPVDCLVSKPPVHYISLGAGVQSSTMALMAKHGIIEPMPMFAVFADTQAEPQSVYKWLDYLETQLPFPVIRVFKHDLEEASTKLRVSKGGNNYAKLAIPAYIVDDAGNKGIMMRQCTVEAKIYAINSYVKKKISKGDIVTEWMGISVDEISRMKDSRDKWKKKRYPLIELNMSRNACLRWMQENGYPKPPRSSCVFCPYHSDDEWLRLKTDEPEEFQRAINYEKKYQETYKQVRNFRGTPYLHKSLKPLFEVEFKNESQLNLFDGECEGYCGV
jgi:hypothetical protein